MESTAGTRTAREYARSSKGRDSRSRSINDQHRANLRDGEKQGWTWGEQYRDTGSAWHRARKPRGDFNRLVADLESGDFGEPGTVLVLWEISRLARATGVGVRVVDLCEANGYMIHVTSHGRTYDPANTNDRDVLVTGIKDAEKEARTISDRTLRGTDANLDEGKFHGKTPFGYARDYEVIDGRPRPVRQYPDPGTAPLVVELFERVAGWGRERESIHAVSVDWKARKITSRYGTPFSAQTLRGMLTQRHYIGERVHTDPKTKITTSRPGTWPALIGPELFEAVQAVLADPTRRSHTTTTIQHVLTMTLRCATCGGPMSVANRQGARKPMAAAYVCNKRGCTTIVKADVDAYMIGDAEKPGAIIQILTNPYLYRAPAGEQVDELDSVRALLAGKRSQLKEFEDTDAETPGEMLMIGRKIDKLNEEIKGLEDRKAELAARQRRADRLDIGPGSTLAEAWSAWESAPLTAQRALVAELLTPEMFGRAVVRRVADSASDAVHDRIAFVNEDGETLAEEWGLTD